MRSCRMLAAFVLALSGDLAHAQAPQPPSDAAKDVVGTWELSNAERDRRCTVTFSVDPAANGFRLDLEPDCGTAFPPIKNVIAWSLDQKGVLRLLDATKSAVIEFSEVEGGLYEGERKDEGLYFLQTQAALKVEIRSADQLFGDWKILRELDKPLCTLTLSNTSDGAEGYKIVVKPGCSPAIAGFGFTGWRLDRDQLVLAGRGGNWRFAESDATIWERVPLTTDPLLLMKQ